MVDYETHSLDNCSGWFKKVGKIIKNDNQKLFNKELGELILGLLFYLGYEFNYLKTGVSADIGYFNRVRNWY